MYNTDMSSQNELPSTARLIRSTIIAAMVALVLLVTVVMPAEYAMDPTGTGRLLGLTEMGEIKEQLEEEGAIARFSWISEGGPINYDTHGDGSGRSISYEKGRGVPQDEGKLEAAFTGNHGWFFRNRNDNDITLVLRTGGDYGELKKML